MAVMMIYKRHHQLVCTFFASAAMLTVCTLACKLSMEEQVDAYSCFAGCLSVSTNMKRVKKCEKTGCSILLHVHATLQLTA